MKEITDILLRSRFGNLIDYLVSEMPDTPEEDENYEKEELDHKVRQSFDTFYTELERLYPSVCFESDDFFNAVVDFARIHDDVYLKIGLLVGFQIYKELETNFKNIKTKDIISFLEKR